MTEKSRPIDSLETLDAYHPPSPPGPIDLDLSSNEGSIPPRSVIDAMCAIDGDKLRRYPDFDELRQTIAAHHEVDPAQVLVTAGGDQALDVLCRAYLDENRTLITHRPTFEMIGRYPRILGASVTEVSWLRGGFPVERFIKAVSAPTDLAVIVTPNNPTGATVTPDQFQTIATAIHPRMLVIDHAYVEFSEDDLTAQAQRHENVVVVRTCSKALGLAGLRVGYLIGDEAIVDILKRVRNPYPLSTPSIEAAVARFSDDLDDVDAFIESIRSRRSQLRSLLESLDLHPYPSQANFVLIEGHPEWLFDALAGLGIKTRFFPEKRTLDAHLRITIPGTDAEYDRLEHAIRTAIDPEVVLFDLDGVIADVRDSYRRAIIETAATFGVSVTHDDINRMKAAGDANDDWELTHALLAEAGVHTDFASVKDEFEDRYHGRQDGQDPLYRHERPLIDADLADLARVIPLGIVTGRPRRDATRFLEDHALTDHFDVVICKEDAQHKPHPEPVELAIERVGCDRAWLIGDTPDDLIAARRAGVLPLGVVPPGIGVDDHRKTLLRHGAALVFDSPSTLTQQLQTRLSTLRG